jgi:hypothetical protein
VTFFAVIELGVGFVLYLLNVKFQLSNLVVSLFDSLTKLSLKVGSHSFLLLVDAVELVLSLSVGAL